MKLLEAFSSIILVCLIFIGTKSYAKIAPDFIHPCNDTSRDCLMKAAQLAIPEFVKGMPEFGVPSLDPFIIEKVKIPLSGITFTMYNVKITGFKNCIIDDIASYLEKRKFMLSFHCNLTTKGTYDAKGRILLFPIDGAGDFKLIQPNIKINMDMNTKYVKDKNNVTHFYIKNYNYTFAFGDRVVFDVKNLFKESKELSDTVLNFLNENWKVVSEEFGKPVIDHSTDLIVKAIQKFFDAVPYEELTYVPLPN